MALAHRTVVGGIQIDRAGTVSIQLKLIVADGPEEFSEVNYRFSMEKEADVVATIAATNAALTSKGRQPIPAKASTIIRNTVTACWTAMDA